MAYLFAYSGSREILFDTSRFGFTVLQRDIERETTFASSLSFRVAVEDYTDRQDDTDKRIALFVWATQ